MILCVLSCRMALGPQGREQSASSRGSSTGRCAALAAIVLAAAATLCACGQEQKTPFADVDVVGRNVNPDGIPYPSDRWGGHPRDGDTAGDRIPNFSFRGYPESDRSHDLQVVSLADYFDPAQKRNKVLMLVAVVGWCPHCEAQTDRMVQAASDLRAEGAVTIETLMQGTEPGVLPAREDLDIFANDHHTTFTVVFDSDGRRIRSVTPVNEVPWNSLIDTRTMEILNITKGEFDDVRAYARSALSWVSQHPVPSP